MIKVMVERHGGLPVPTGLGCHGGLVLVPTGPVAKGELTLWEGASCVEGK